MAASLNQSIGDYQSHHQTPHGVDIAAENAAVAIRVYSQSTVRVRAAAHAADFDDVSYAIHAEPEQARWHLREYEDRLILITDRLTLLIEKRPLRMTFLTPDGSILNADDPAFGISWIGEEVAVYKTLRAYERFIGLGEKTGNLDRRGSAYTNWNTDYYGYPPFADPLYASVPFYIGIHNGLAYGIYFDNTHRTHFNFGAANDRFAAFSAASGTVDYYFIHGAAIADIIEAYTHLTGRMPMPPKWSLGYQQCRYSYYPDTEVLRVAQTFREKQIPADVIYLDIHYMDRFRVFTWDENRFPDPAGLIRKLKALGFRTVAIVDPGIKIEEGYAPYEDGVEKDVFVKYPDGRYYAGKVWPGWCHFPDFTNPKTRQWWARWIETLTGAGVEGFWCDMNEPAAWGRDVPDLIEFDCDGHPCTHKKARNIYGMQMARSAYAASRDQMGNRRPFVLTRAGFAGVQRYAAIWTGDNVADDDHMLAGIRLVNSMGISGLAFSGYDIAGFTGNATAALFARWMSIGAFSPLFRGHTAVNSRSAEPWVFGEEVEAIARNYIRLRYRLMPYIYSAFYASTESGMPVARSLAIDYPHDPRVYDIFFHNQYLFGPFILVIPVRSDQFISRAYLPPGRWYDMYTDKEATGGRDVYVDAPLSRLPVFVRAGAVIPMVHAGSNIDPESNQPLQIHVYPPADDLTGFTYYEDDGETFDYEKGGYLRRQICLESGRMFIGAAEGGFGSRHETLQICFHNFGFPDGHVRVNGAQASLAKESFRLCDPISPFDPSGEKEDPYGNVTIHTLSIPNGRESIEILFY